MSTGFICVGKPDYGWFKKVKALEPHAFQQWRNGAVSMREHLKPEVNQASFVDPSYNYRDVLMDSDEVAAWTEAGIEITMSKVKGIGSNSRSLPDVIYQISVPNVGLMQVQLVEVLEDCCTNELQGWLDKGWRILAVCPPNDTRRPTYIVGHTDREKAR